MEYQEEMTEQERDELNQIIDRAMQSAGHELGRQQRLNQRAERWATENPELADRSDLVNLVNAEMRRLQQSGFNGDVEGLLSQATTNIRKLVGASSAAPAPAPPPEDPLAHELRTRNTQLARTTFDQHLKPAEEQLNRTGSYRPELRRWVADADYENLALESIVEQENAERRARFDPPKQTRVGAYSEGERIALEREHLARQRREQP